MAGGLQDVPSLLQAYHREFLAERLPGYARLGAGVAFAINTAFVALDYVSFGEHFRFFLTLRLALNALCLGIYFFASERFPRLSIWSVQSAVAPLPPFDLQEPCHTERSEGATEKGVAELRVSNRTSFELPDSVLGLGPPTPRWAPRCGALVSLPARRGGFARISMVLRRIG